MYHKDLLPLDYPWHSERRALLLNGEDEYPLEFVAGETFVNSVIRYNEEIELPLDEFLSVKSKAKILDRIPVVAIGSNASPLVTRSKISRYGMRGTNKTLPMFPAKMKNMGVGYSGHFVSGGYIPAAPYHDEGGELDVTVSFMTREQVYAIDSTEPTYRRELVSKELYPVTLENGEVLEDAYIYTTRFGVLRGQDGFPIPLASQASLYTLLHETGVGKGFFRGESQHVSDRIAGKGVWAANRITAKDVFEGILISDGITVIEAPKKVYDYEKESYGGFSESYWDRMMTEGATPAEDDEFYDDYVIRNGSFSDRYYGSVEEEFPDDSMFLDDEWLEAEALADEAFRDAANDAWLGEEDFDLYGNRIFPDAKKRKADKQVVNSEEAWMNSDFDARYDNWWNAGGSRSADAAGF